MLFSRRADCVDRGSWPGCLGAHKARFGLEKRKMSLPSASALASRLGVMKQRSGRARAPAPGRGPGSGLLSEGISGRDGGQLPPSSPSRGLPPGGELRRRMRLGAGHPGQPSNQGKLREEGETFQKADRVCSSYSEGLDIVASAGSGFGTSYTERAQDRERLSSGLLRESAAMPPSEALSSVLSAPRQAGPQLLLRSLRLRGQHPQGQFIYLWFNEHQMLRPETWRPRKSQSQAHCLQSMHITAPHPRESRGRVASEPTAGPLPRRGAPTPEGQQSSCSNIRAVSSSGK